MPRGTLLTTELLMTTFINTKIGAFSALTAALLVSAPAFAELSAEELAKLAQNPVGNLISVPFQNNTNLNVGPDNRS
ncbi:MAG: hypothetical protein WCA83_02495, partial [Azonexus sp.]